MIQLEEKGGLAPGQKIEAEFAKEAWELLNAQPEQLSM